MSKGANKEKKISLDYSNKTAILVSGLLLRRIGAGQVDYCFIDGRVIYVLEVKSSITGALSFQRGQRSRLLRSAALLSEITGLSVRILLV